MKFLTGLAPYPTPGPLRVAANKWAAEHNTTHETSAGQNRQHCPACAAGRCFFSVAKTLRKDDPNHLCLGDGFRGVCYRSFTFSLLEAKNCLGGH